MAPETVEHRDAVMIRNAVVLALHQFCRGCEIARIMGIGLSQVYAHKFHARHPQYASTKRRRAKLGIPDSWIFG